MKDEINSVKIVLNEEQTQLFLSFFIPEAIEIVKKRSAEKKGKEITEIKNLVK